MLHEYVPMYAWGLANLCCSNFMVYVLLRRALELRRRYVSQSRKSSDVPNHEGSTLYALTQTDAGVLGEKVPEQMDDMTTVPMPSTGSSYGNKIRSRVGLSAAGSDGEDKSSSLKNLGWAFPIHSTKCELCIPN